MKRLLMRELERACRRVRLLKWIVLGIYHGGRFAAAILVPVLAMALMLAFYGGAIYMGVYVAVIAARHAGAIP